MYINKASLLRHGSFFHLKRVSVLLSLTALRRSFLEGKKFDCQNIFFGESNLIICGQIIKYTIESRISGINYANSRV